MKDETLLKELKLKKDTKSSSYSTPETWGKEGSQEFKDNKKAYNQWYYQMNKDYWIERAKNIKNNIQNNTQKAKDLENTNRTKNNALANIAMQKAYQQAGEAYGKAMENAGKTRVSDISSSSSVSLGRRAIDSSSDSHNRTSFTSLFTSGLKSIVSFGKSILGKLFG